MALPATMFVKVLTGPAGNPTSQCIIPGAVKVDTEWDDDGNARVKLTTADGGIEHLTVEDDNTVIYITNETGGTIGTVRRRKQNGSL